MAKGETIILKLRKKDDPEKPYFTVQVSPKTFKVLHKETSNRKSESKDTTEFIKAWVKHIEKHINKSKPKNNIRRIDHEHRIAN